MIATNALQVETGLVLVKRIRCQIQHSEVECLVLKNMVDSSRFLNRLLPDGLWHKHTIVQIAFVDLPHIHQTEHGQQTNHQFSTHLIVSVQQQAYRANCDNPERTPAVGCKHSHSHLRQVLQQRCQLFGRNLTHGLHLALTDKTGEEQLRHQSEKQGNAARQSKGDKNILQLLSHHLRFIDNLFQCQHSQQGDGKLGYHKDRGHRAELGIHRHIIEEEVGKRHEVTAP